MGKKPIITVQRIDLADLPPEVQALFGPVLERLAANAANAVAYAAASATYAAAYAARATNAEDTIKLACADIVRERFPAINIEALQ